MRIALRMGTLRCVRCGYELGGLPVSAGLIRCPECAKQQHLAIADDRLGFPDWLAPIVWAVLPTAPALVCVAFVDGRDEIAPALMAMLVALCSGTTLGGVLIYRLLKKRDVLRAGAERAAQRRGDRVLQTFVFSLAVVLIDGAILLVGAALIGGAAS